MRHVRAAGLALGRVLDVEVHQQTHPDGGRVPSGRHQRAEMRAGCRFLIQMEGLGILFLREGDHFLAVKRCCPAGACCRSRSRRNSSCEARSRLRRANRMTSCCSVATLVAALEQFEPEVTRPRSGLLLEVRLSRTVRRSVSTSPGKIGAFHFTSDTPGEPRPAARRRKASQAMRWRMAQACQPKQPARPASRPCRLQRPDAWAGVEVPSEGDDFPSVTV